MSGDPALSVVVLAHGAAPHVTDAVASLLGQSSGERVEVVVVTSGGDCAAAAVRGRFPDLRVLESPGRLLPGAARNVGVAATTGDVVAFLAADCLAEPGWVADRLAAHRAGHPVVASAVALAPPRTPAAWGSHLALFGARAPGRPAGPVVAGDPAAHGLSFDRAVLIAIGPFPEDVRVGEDTAVAERLAAAGIEIWFAPEVRAAHRAPGHFDPMVRTHFGRGARAARQNPPRDWRPAGQGRRLNRALLSVQRQPRRALLQAIRFGRGARGRAIASAPWIVAAAAASRIGRVRQSFRWLDRMSAPGAPAATPRLPAGTVRSERCRDGGIAVGLGGIAAALYTLTLRPDWIFDTMRYAQFTEDGKLQRLLVVQHLLGNAVPLVLYRALRATGSDVRALPVLSVVAVAGAAAAVALVFLAARRLGGTRLGSLVAAATLAAALGTWRAGASAGVYGLALAALALAWVSAAAFAARPGNGRAALAGAAGGVAVATHLGAIAFLPAGALLVAGRGGRAGRRGRVRRLAAFGGGAIVTAGAIMLPIALALGHGSLPRALGFLVPRLGGVADPVLRGGPSLRGLPAALAVPVGSPIGRVVGAAAAALLAGLALGRGVALLAVRGRPRAVGAALLVNAVGALAGAAIAQGGRADYFCLALPPLALLWAAGGPLLVPRRIPRSRSVAAASLAAAVALAGWNLAFEVGPGRRDSRTDAAAVAEIAGAVPPGAVVLLSANLAPTVDYQTDALAITGWGALLHAVRTGAPPPGLDAVVVRMPGRPLYVSDRALDLSPRQRAALGVTGEELWERLRACCAPRASITVQTSAGPETLYVLQSRPSGP